MAKKAAVLLFILFNIFCSSMFASPTYPPMLMWRSSCRASYSSLLNYIVHNQGQMRIYLTDSAELVSLHDDEGGELYI